MTASANGRDIAGKHILVTGGAGFIGSHLVDLLIERGAAEVTVIDSFFLGRDDNLAPARRTRPDLCVLRLDIADEHATRQAFDALPPVDVVFDLAVIPLPTSLEQPKWCFDTNVGITSVLCELLREGRFETLVHFSSSEAYGSARSVPMDEEHPLEPRTPYAASKAASDHLVRTYAATFGVDALVIRPFNNYGPRQNDRRFAGIIPTLLHAAFSGQVFALFGDGSQTRDYIFVGDTVRAACDLYMTPEARGRVVNIGSGVEISMLDLIAAVERELGRTIALELRPERPGDVRRHCADIGLLRSLIGFTPRTTLADGLAQTIAYYRERLAPVTHATVPGTQEI